MSYVWIVPNKLAQGPLPRINELENLSRVFDVFIVLIMPHEVPGGIDYYLSMLNSYGIEYVHVPTPDFHPLQLLELYYLSNYIEKQISSGRRVYVHCRGGVGRSGLVTASYLVYKGQDLIGAVKYLRERIPYALETIGQQRMLEDYYSLMKIIDKDHFRKLFNHFMKHGSKTMFKHSSKTAQLVIELADLFSLRIDKSMYKTLLASILHPIQDLSIVEKILKDTCINIDYCEKTVFSIMSALKNWATPRNREELLIFVSHMLDYTRDQRVVFTDTDMLGVKANLILYCDYDCTIIIDKLGDLLGKIREEIGKEIMVYQQSYMDSV
ncbi:protein-tyrosine phosphatase family protein [Staphylothermus hellenicus]|uniref:protein-tyrosine phosphatase family protein n=1 Tax=Staphylothermus hellenicus TaxID=84599 RepID=UPI0011E5006E|nr:dual specificity protein phosphatase family protein [Staphylothermus hellenicus]